jgi:hypothetical protein
LFFRFNEIQVKKFDLEKNKGLKLNNALKQAGSSARFGQGSAVVPDRREQRRLDQQNGLLPFACKLDGELIKQLQDRAAEHEGGMTAVLTALLIAGGLTAKAAD